MCALCLAFITHMALAQHQSTSNYETLIQRANAQLQNGNNDQALASANAAIKLNAQRWEAYAISGGALKNLSRCDDAVKRFNRAAQLAPADKQSGIEDLKNQCLEVVSHQSSTAGVASSVSGPSYEKTVQWIVGNFSRVGIDSFLAHQKRTGRPVYTTSYSYKISINACDAQVVESNNDVAVNADDNNLFTSNDVYVYNFPLAGISDVVSSDVDAYRSGSHATYFERGMPGVVIDILFANPIHLKWNILNGDDVRDNLAANDMPLIMGGADGIDLAPHMIAAIKHLAEICKTSPQLQNNHAAGSDLF
jgi:tetratricopeptide (TPR) repeat protein